MGIPAQEWNFSVPLWIRVYTLVDTVLHVNLQKDPWEALLHKPIADVTRREYTLITHMFMATKQTIARSWKTPFLSFKEVKNRVHGMLINVKLTVILEDKYDKFQRTWQPWIDHFPPSQMTSRFLKLWGSKWSRLKPLGPPFPIPPLSLSLYLSLSSLFLVSMCFLPILLSSSRLWLNSEGCGYIIFFFFFLHQASCSYLTVRTPGGMDNMILFWLPEWCLFDNFCEQ